MDNKWIAVIAALVAIAILLTTICIELTDLGNRVNVLEHIEWTEQ